MVTLFSVPGASPSGQRRHSYQSGQSGAAAAGLAKEMSRLKVSAAERGRGGGPSPRGSTKRRSSSSRRSSRSGKENPE